MTPRRGRRPLLLAICLVVVSSSALAGSGDAPPSWQRTIIQDIRQSEYRFGEVGTDTWSAPNRAQDVRSFISADGLRVVPRTRQDRPWELSLRLVGFGRGTELADPGPARARVDRDGGRVELVRPALSEWYRNDEDGLEQGFTLGAPPPGAERSQPLIVEMALESDLRGTLTADGQTVQFGPADGPVVLTYSKLLVLDAGGRKLDSRFELDGDRLRIVTDDRGADYPLLVDPLLTTPDWSAESDQAFALFGTSVAMGDFNCDGIDDIAVGASEFDATAPSSDEGGVFVYYGSSSGPSSAVDWSATSDHTNSKFGASVASAGDVDGSGCDDLIVGAYRYDDDTAMTDEVDEGWAFVYYGPLNSGGLRPFGTPGNADWTVESNQADAYLGRSVDGAGDVNGDLADDVIVGAWLYTNDQSFEGAAFAFHGSNPDGLDLGTGRSPGTPANADWFGDDVDVESEYGRSVASAGNVNGDSYDDVLVGAPAYETNFDNEGRAFLYLGSASGLSSSPIWTLDGGQNDGRVAAAVSSAGDVNNDGLDDVMVGAADFSFGQSGEGVVFLFYGRSNALLGTTPTWIGQVNQGGAGFGGAIAPAGDVNGDQYDDVIIGAEAYSDGEIGEGAAFLFLGSIDGLPEFPTATYEVNVQLAELGESVGGSGDVNDDGFADIVLGADEYASTETDEGAAFVFFGCADGDRDGACQAADNCPIVPNPGQIDTDGDGVGNLCDPCEDADLDTVCDEPRVLVEWQGAGEQILVQEGSVMKFYANTETVNPGFGLQWTQFAFGEVGWTLGLYGVGYEDPPGGGATDLLTTSDPPDPGTVSIYTRAQFVIDDINEVENLFLGVDYDDGYVAWINGVEVLRSGEMPPTVPTHNTKPAGHESSNGSDPDYEPLQDISIAGLNAIQDGLNVLAIGVWNTSDQSSDLVLVPRLSYNHPSSSMMKFLSNDHCCVDTGLALTWTEFGFDDSGWDNGSFGVGFEAGPCVPMCDANDLIHTEALDGSFSVYTRTRFNVDPGDVNDVFLGADYSDGYVVWINGVEMIRSPEMSGAPGSDPTWMPNPPPTLHESSNMPEPVYGTLLDITGLAKPLLNLGDNVLAMAGYRTPGQDRLVFTPRLSVNEVGIDNCVGVFNPDQNDVDGDGLGDACDPDIDGDTLLNGVDNCPFVDNLDQNDGDVDLIGDVCDSCPDDAANDGDADGVCVGTGFAAPKVGDEDNCPTTYNPPADCDDMPGTPDEQCDLDSNGEGDECDLDIDGDMVDNDVDNCPLVSNNGQLNTDINDPNGDVCDCAFENDQSWERPGVIDTLKMAREDLCANFACSQTATGCVGDVDCQFDQCQNKSCLESLGVCDTDADCESDVCENFTCTAGMNLCTSDLECTADVCENRTCTQGGNCTSDTDCTADFCTGRTCVLGMNVCTSNDDCVAGGDFCLGACSISTGTPCLDDAVCTADTCGAGACSVGTNACTDDSVCVADFCEGECSIGPGTCLDDNACTATQTDLCKGTCSLGGMGVCSNDSNCMEPQTDLCRGVCSIGTNVCGDDTVCVQPDADVLFWAQPLEIGSVSVEYDTLRSADQTDFNAPASCVETDGADGVSFDATDPAVGNVNYYLIRIENDCDPGEMGANSQGTDRLGKICE